MKTKEIASQYGINQVEFEQYLRSIGAGKDGIMAYTLDDNIAGHVEGFKVYKAEKEAEREAARKEREEAEKIKKAAEDEKQRALASMMISSGFSFEGYKITKYSGYISGDDAVQIPRTGWFGSSNTGEKLTEALSEIRRKAIAELKEAAYDLGCNAVVGVDFDYINMDPQTANFNGGTTYEPYVICVTANGNAVVIEKE